MGGLSLLLNNGRVLRGGNISIRDFFPQDERNPRGPFQRVTPGLVHVESVCPDLKPSWTPLLGDLAQDFTVFYPVSSKFPKTVFSLENHLESFFSEKFFIPFPINVCKLCHRYRDFFYLYLKLYLFISVNICGTACMWRSRDNLQESVFF